MYFEIITPEKKIFAGEVLITTFPGTDGSFQVMNDHAPLISSLKSGIVEYKDKKSTYELEITGGVVEVLNNNVILLAEGIKSN